MLVGEGSTNTKSASTISNYPIHRQRPGSFSHRSAHPSHPSHSSHHLSAQSTLPHHYSLTNVSHPSYRSRSTTSPETQNGHHQPYVQQNRDQPGHLRSGYSAGSLQNAYQPGVISPVNIRGWSGGDPAVFGRPANYKPDGHACVPERNLTYSAVGHPLPERSLSYSAVGHPPRPHVYLGKTVAPSPSLPPKGIRNMQDAQFVPIPHTQSNFKPAHWNFSTENRGQGSQLDSSVGPGYSVGGYSVETTSEHSLSDSTQASDISEPIFRRSRCVRVYGIIVVIVMASVSTYSH